MVNKLFRFLLFSFIFILPFFSSIPLTTPAYATNDSKCSGSGKAFAYKPGTFKPGADSADPSDDTGTPADDTDTHIDLVIYTGQQLSSLASKNSGYYVGFTQDPNAYGDFAYISSGYNGSTVLNPDSDGKFIIPDVNPIGKTDDSGSGGKFIAKTYSVRIDPALGGNNDSVCEASFNIVGTATGPDNYCAINIVDIGSTKTKNPLKFTVKFTGDPATDPSLHADSMHHVYITDNDTGQKFTFAAATNVLEGAVNNGVGDGYIPFDVLSTGGYSIEVMENDPSIIFQNEGRSCTKGDVHTGPNGGYVGCIVDADCGHHNTACKDQANCLCLPAIVSPVPGQPNEIGAPVCRTPSAEEGRNPCVDQGGNNFICQTAIGAIGTSASGFAKSVLQLFLALAGVILLFIIILNGYKFITSQGDPEKVKEARESITSAIAGLIVVALAIVILQFITFTVLGLPGFK